MEHNPCLLLLADGPVFDDDCVPLERFLEFGVVTGLTYNIISRNFFLSPSIALFTCNNQQRMPNAEESASADDLMTEEMGEMRQRRARTTEMGEPVPRRVERKQPKPATEWTKAIAMSLGLTMLFVVFSLNRRGKFLSRKTSDFKSFDKCNLATYPMWKIDEVQELNLSKCDHVHLPDDVEVWSKFKSLKKLDLSGNSLGDLPMAMEILAPSLEILFLSGNKFTKLPDVIKKLTKLRVLSMRDNFLTELSTDGLPVSSLVWLILTNNQIARIYPNIKDLKLLRKLMLSHNSLSEIPVELGECKDLELVRLANNNLNAIPTEVLLLPKLGWMSLSGNPIFASNTPSNGSKIIKEQDVEINKTKILGQGASGVVYAGQYAGKDVAVKVFKEQSKGSDGNPEDELAINSIIDHTFAISALGVIEINRKKEMMVMNLLKGTHPLGKVPSFETVTRDAGPSPESKKIFDEEILLRTVWNVASALEYIHSSVGVSHGDVYLHNILIDGERVSRLSDWGASFAYDRGSIEQAELIEKIEVLAFGRLMQDLFLWNPKIIAPGGVHDLINQIVQPDTSRRPNFRAVKEHLSAIPEMSAIVNA
jgi:hypothetical protein